MAITAQTLRLQQQLRRLIVETTDAQTRDLVKAWATAWDEIEPDLAAILRELLTTSGNRISAAQMLRSQRLLDALRHIADQLDALSHHAGVQIVGDLRDVIETAGAAQASILDSQLPPGYADSIQLTQWARIDPRQIDAIIARSTEQITSRLLPLSADTSAMIRRELIRGVTIGANPRTTAARMVRSAEARFNGDLGLTRALRVARTETLDAHRAAALAGRMQNRDLLAGWRWLCELSKRSCPACIAQNGTLHPIDEPGPNDHVCGRCTAVPETKSWADLGFGDVPEPPSLLPDAGTWFEQLPSADQRAILGPGRFDAWQAGAYPMSDWSTIRHADGWRDSIQVSAMPQPSRSVRLAS